jgi:hypothetical protein
MDTSSNPHLADTFEESLGPEHANFHVLGKPLPSYLGVHVNEIDPYEVFNFGIMPLILVEILVIEFNSNSVEGNTSKKMLNLTLLTKFLRILSPKRNPMEAIAIANPQPP